MQEMENGVRLLHIVAGEPMDIFIDADGETITREAVVLHLNIVFMPHDMRQHGRRGWRGGVSKCKFVK
jgi:hypothetical protein